MKQLLAIASAAVFASGLAYAEPASSAKAGSSKSAAATASSKAAPSKTKKVAVIPDRSTAAAPHRYPASARVLPPSRPLASGAKSQAGTVHKDAPLDQVAGAGG